MCPGVGRDATTGYASLRLLAVELARSGYTTLRFDYLGTGNSGDLDGQDPGATWLANIGAAADALRATGVRRIVFCGVRLGALLAATKAVDEADACAVVLVDAVMSGSGYLRELRIASQLGSGGPALDDSPLELDDLHLTDSAAAALRSLSLRSMEMKPGLPLLLLNSAASAASRKFAERMRALGSEVSESGFEPMNDHDENGEVTRVSPIGAVKSWLVAVARPSFRVTPPAWPRAAASLSTGSFSEQALRFGPAGRLFGMLCRPRQSARPNLVVLIGSAGAASHHGHFRFHVMLARRLAEAGIASLRLDFAGLGESDPGAHEESTHVYATGREGDIASANRCTSGARLPPVRGRRLVLRSVP